MFPATIAIPVHNGAKRVGAVLEGLARQTVANGSFEVLIVDNASSDTLSEVVLGNADVKALEDRGMSCRLVREERLGLTYARIRAVCEARSELVCFLDDDALPDERYVENGIAVFADPEVGLTVSSVSPRWETKPPHSVVRREWLFAASRRLGEEFIDLGTEATLAPTIGSGMWVRRRAFLDAVPWQQPESLLVDRRGSQLTSGGDIEIGYLLGKAGYKRVYAPCLQLAHLIPSRRFELRSVCRLIDGVVRSELTLQQKYRLPPYTLASRVRAVISLIGVFAAIPVLLVRRDGAREVLFALVSRWARAKGPYCI